MATNAQSPSEGSSLAGSVALITGGSQGIGLAIARRLGRMGARVAICARHQESLDQAAGELRAGGFQVLAVPADVRSASAVADLVRQVAAGFGPIDILINNAGVGIFGLFHESSEADWDAVLNTNLKSVFLVSRAVAPEMIRRGRGQIVNISSLAGKNAFAKGGLYCASKWGLMGLTACMAEELRVHGIRVSVVCPGSVATEFSSHSGRAPETLLQADDVAHAVAMLVTEGPHSFISEVDLRPRKKP
jgi:3-oxoacyl-[acyl-carrier protein] reductase